MTLLDGSVRLKTEGERKSKKQTRAAKEEIANINFISLLELVEKMGLSHLKNFRHHSGGSAKEMFTLLGEMVKSELEKRHIHISSSKFLGVVYLVHELLPIPSHLSRSFGKGNVHLLQNLF